MNTNCRRGRHQFIRAGILIRVSYAYVLRNDGKDRFSYPLSFSVFTRRPLLGFRLYAAKSSFERKLNEEVFFRSDRIDNNAAKHRTALVVSYYCRVYKNAPRCRKVSNHNDEDDDPLSVVGRPFFFLHVSSSYAHFFSRTR